MSETITIQKVYKELEDLKRRFARLEHMIDPDTIMTPQESDRHEQAMNELRERKTTSLEDLEKELGL